MFSTPETRAAPQPTQPAELPPGPPTARRPPPPAPPPRPSVEPVTVQRRPSATGVIMVAGQKLALGHSHAHTTVTVHVTKHTITVDFPDGAQRTFSRTTTTQPVLACVVSDSA